MELSKIKAEQSLDDSLSNAGALLEFDGYKFYVARWGNRRFEAHWRRLLENPEIRRKYDRDLLKPEEDRALADQVIANTILVGWSDIEEGGKPLDYSPDKAVELLKLELLREEIIRFAKDNANFRAQQIADGIDALKKSSSGA